MNIIKKSLVGITLFGLMSYGIINDTNSVYDADVSIELNTVEGELFNLINQYRIKNGVPVIKWGDDIQKMARRHAYYVSQIGTSSHKEEIDIPNFIEESRLANRAYIIGYNGSNVLKIGENVNYKIKSDTPYETAKSTFNGWKNSSSHNKLMLNHRYDLGSCGCKESDILLGKKRNKTYVACTLNVVDKK